MKHTLLGLVIATIAGCTPPAVAGPPPGIVPPGAPLTLTREAVQSRVLSELRYVKLNAITTELYTATQFVSKFKSESSYHDPNGIKLYPQPDSPIWVTTIEGEGLVHDGRPGFGGKLMIAMFGENYSHPLLDDVIVAGQVFMTSNFF